MSRFYEGKTYKAKDKAEAKQLRKMLGGNATVVVEGAQQEASDSPQKRRSSARSKAQGEGSSARRWRVTAPDGGSFTTEQEHFTSLDGKGGYSVEEISPQPQAVRGMSQAAFDRLKKRALKATKRKRAKAKEARH